MLTQTLSKAMGIDQRQITIMTFKISTKHGNSPKLLSNAAKDYHDINNSNSRMVTFCTLQSKAAK